MATCYVQSRSLPDGRRRFDVKYRRGGRYTRLEHAGTFHTMREAVLRRTAVREWLAAGLNPKVELRRRAAISGRTLTIVADEWIASRRSVSDGTRAGYGFRLPTILDGFKTVSTAEITVEDVNQWVGKLTNRYKPGTVRLFVQQLRMILDHADLPANPARSKRVELPRATTQTLEPPSSDQVLRAVAGVAEDLVVPLLTMEQLGTRVSETLSLTRADIGDQRVRLRGETVKTGQSRWVPAPDLLTDALIGALPFRGTRNRVSGALRHADAGFTPHDLRHRRASLWLAQGHPPATVAAWLGHSVAQLLRTYTHVIVDEEIAAHDLASLLR